MRTWLSHIELNSPCLVIRRLDLNSPGLITLWLDLSSPFLVILALDLELFLSHHTVAWHKNGTILSLCKHLVSSTILKYNTYPVILRLDLNSPCLVIVRLDWNTPCLAILWLDFKLPSPISLPVDLVFLLQHDLNYHWFVIMRLD